MTEHSRCMCGEPWRLNAVHREKTPCFDYIEHRWVGLTDEDWEQIHDRKRTALDTFAQGAVWAADQLKGRNT